jgi:very-short-patch-repair endonuclease
VGVARCLIMSKNLDIQLQRDPHPNPPHKGEGTKEEFARSLRKNETPAERILWQQLRLLKSEGRHFRRQVPIDKYMADFACHYPKLVVKLDGGQHGDAINYDEARTKILNSHGFKAQRFWNTEIFETLEGVVDRIRHEVGLSTAFTYDYMNVLR